MISVIVPFFNSERYLKDCLQSILKQSYSEIEIVCIDDGSTDSSAAIVAEIMESDKRIRLFQQKNKGRSAARNLGIEVSIGEYICFVDSDDLIPPDSLELLLSSLNKNKTDAAVGSITVEYDAHRELRESDLAYYTITKKGAFKVTDELIESFHSSACGCLFKRTIINKFSLKFPEGLNYEDAYWHWCYFPLCRKISFVNNTVYRYIRRPNSIMSQTFETKKSIAIDHIYIIGEIYSFLKKNNLIEGREKTLLNLLEQYFWLSIKYSEKYETSIVAYQCAILLRKMKFNLDGNKTMKNIYEGNLEFLYNQSLSELNGKELVLFLRLKSLADSLFPEGTKRRAVLYRFGRFVFRSLKRS